MMHSLFLGSNEFGIGIFTIENQTLSVEIVNTYLFGSNGNFVLIIYVK